MIKVQGNEIVNAADEMSLELYERLSELLEARVMKQGDKPGTFDYESELDKWQDILEAVGLPKEVTNEMELDELVEVVKAWNGTEKKPYQMVKEFELNGRTYRAFEGEKWSLNIKDGKLIEKYARQNPKRYVGKMLAVIFKDTSLSNAEHYANAHIKHKADIFRKEVKASVAVPYLMHVATKILNAGQQELEQANTQGQEVETL